MEFAVFMVACAVMIVIAITRGDRADRRCREQIETWAGESGLHVQEVRRRWIWFGPFWWRTSRNQRVYEIDASDSAGVPQRFIARVGGWIGGSRVQRVDVERL